MEDNTLLLVGNCSFHFIKKNKDKALFAYPFLNENDINSERTTAEEIKPSLRINDKQ